MPMTHQMITSKFIGHADVDPAIVVTIKTCTLETVGRQGEEEQKWFLWFNEHKKGMRLNVTTIRILEAAYGMNTDLWVGKRIKLYWDPNVQMAGQLVGGVRVRLPSASSTAAAAAPPGARFDPLTGKPLQAAPVARFDPNTGLPIGTAAPTAMASPETDEFGSPAVPSGGGAVDPDFDDDIPF